MSELSQLHQQFCDYALVFKGNTPRTIRWFEETFDYFLRRTDLTTLDEMTREAIEDYIVRGRIDKRWSSRTIRNRVSALKSFLDWTVNRGYLKENPTNGIDLPKLRYKLQNTLPETRRLICSTGHAAIGTPTHLSGRGRLP